jgi:hypothetical protein
MIGAILVAGLVAAMSSLLATLSNILIARKFPGIAWDSDPDLPEPLYIRITCYRLVARIFYYQSLIFWTLLGLLGIVKLLHRFGFLWR